MGSINRKVKELPNICQWAYYNLVPFENRYGEEYKKTLDFLMKSSKWSEESRKDYQLTELKHMLSHCYWNVPYYRKIFIDNQWMVEDFQTIEDLKNFPILVTLLSPFLDHCTPLLSAFVFIVLNLQIVKVSPFLPTLF